MPSFNMKRRLARLESAATAAAPKACPNCPALEPGGPGGPISHVAVLTAADQGPGMAYVFCAKCGRTALARTARDQDGGLLVLEPKAAEMPV